jgi:hypothetical protein
MNVFTTSTQKPSAHDQVLADVEMPYRATYYPLGFPVDMISNSQRVLDAAAESWGQFRQRFTVPPLTVRLGVTQNPDDLYSLPQAPICRLDHHLVSHIADSYNFATCDLNEGSAFGWVTERTVEAPLYLRYHFLEASALCMIAASRASPLHAACVSMDGFGLLLCGDSGAGKSSLAFAAGRSGFTYTCDDASYLLLNRKPPTVVGNCHQFRLRESGTILFPELQGRTVTPRAAGKPSLEIPTSEFGDILTCELTSISAIVFLNRQNVTQENILPFSKSEAARWFRQTQVFKTTSLPLQLSAIERLTNLPIFEMRYTNLDWAVECLRQLATGGSAG